MPSDESVTEWIASLKAQEEQAAQELYQRYLTRLATLARKKLGGVPRRVADEEDAAHEALNSFFGGEQKGRFPKLNDRHDLWQILVMLTERKAINQMRRQFSKKRRGEVGESALDCPDVGSSRRAGIAQMCGRDPSPEFAAELSEELHLRMERLQNPHLQQIAIWKMEGRTNEEIAKRLGCVTRTVERRLELIRNLWESE